MILYGRLMLIVKVIHKYLIRKQDTKVMRSVNMWMILEQVVRYIQSLR